MRARKETHSVWRHQRALKIRLAWPIIFWIFFLLPFFSPFSCLFFIFPELSVPFTIWITEQSRHNKTVILPPVFWWRDTRLFRALHSFINSRNKQGFWVWKDIKIRLFSHLKSFWENCFSLEFFLFGLFFVFLRKWMTCSLRQGFASPQMQPTSPLVSPGCGSMLYGYHLNRLGDYVIERKCGQGQFGKVLAATHVPSGTLVAIKCIEKSRLRSEALRLVEREAYIMKVMRHPNNIRFATLPQCWQSWKVHFGKFDTSQFLKFLFSSWDGEVISDCETDDSCASLCRLDWQALWGSGEQWMDLPGDGVCRVKPGGSVWSALPLGREPCAPLFRADCICHCLLPLASHCPPRPETFVSRRPLFLTPILQIS